MCSNKKVFFNLMLVLLFSVAVSSGCGGGGGGHYSGDFGDSSQNVTPEIDSQDVIPENPTSGDENGDEDYGVNGDDYVYYKFDLLNNSVWKPYMVAVYRLSDGIRTLCTFKGNEISFNYKVSRIRLATKDRSLVWFDQKNMEHLKYDDYNLKVEIIDPDDGTEQTIPILRTQDSFKVSPGSDLDGTSDFMADIPRHNFTNETDTEEITLNQKVGPNLANELEISNTCKGTNGKEYVSFFTLKRLNLKTWESDGHNFYTETFETLNNTDWTIKSIDIVGPNGKSRSIKKNTYNYNVSKITLLTYPMNMNNDLSEALTWLDGNNNPPRNNNNALTVNFSGGIFTTYTAPLLKPAIGFKYKGQDNGGTLEFQTTYLADTTQVKTTQNTEKIFQHDWGSEPFVRISNSFMIDNQQYTANMVLVPDE